MGEKFTLVRILANRSASETTSAWGQFNCELLRYYRDAPPAPNRQRCSTENLIIWQILRGTVVVSTGGIQLKAHAGERVAINRGERIQEFSADAQLESIHLKVTAPRAAWHGPQASLLPHGLTLEKSVRALGREAQRQGILGRSWQLSAARSVTLTDFARLQKATWIFFAELLPHLQLAGMELREPVIADPRIRQSRHLLEALPMATEWDRTLLPRSIGISASQLDRNWVSALGQTPFQYWEARRIQFAREKLENTRWSIKEIASELGFRQLGRFSNWFRTKQSVSPRQYRERVGH